MTHRAFNVAGLLVAVFGLLLVRVSLALDGPAPLAKDQPCIVIMASFPAEMRAIDEKVAPHVARSELTELNGISLRTAEVAGKRCIFLVTGMSYVNAAASTQLVLDHFRVKAVLFSGIAGGVNPSLHPGDVVVPSRWYHHGEMAYLHEDPAGSGNYQIPVWYRQKRPNFGFMFSDDVTVKREGMPQFQQVGFFPADAKLVSLATQAAGALPAMKTEDRVSTVSCGGNGVSGTVFNDNPEYRKWVFSTFHADCLDMESTPIAQVCWQNKTPCLIVRGLSDIAGGQRGQNQEEIYSKAAAEHAALVLGAVLQEMTL